VDQVIQHPLPFGPVGIPGAVDVLGGVLVGLRQAPKGSPKKVVPQFTEFSRFPPRISQHLHFRRPVTTSSNPRPPIASVLHFRHPRAHTPAPIPAEQPEPNTAIQFTTKPPALENPRNSSPRTRSHSSPSPSRPASRPGDHPGQRAGWPLQRDLRVLPGSRPQPLPSGQTRGCLAGYWE